MRYTIHCKVRILKRVKYRPSPYRWQALIFDCCNRQREKEELLKSWKPGPNHMIRGAKTRLTTAMSLIRIFMEGPEVSFKGSPTVSPITEAA